MSSQRTKMTVGIFVTGGLCIALAALIWLGMSRFLQDGAYYVTYFDESVQGLIKDSPVKYRGVSIGRVHRIDVAPDSQLIEVVLMVESGQKLDREMVSQIKAVGITGSMFVEIDRRRPDEPDRSPALTFPTQYPVIASRPSDMSELLKGLDDIISQFRALDVDGITRKIEETLDGAGRLMVEADVAGISTGVKEVLISLKEITDGHNKGSLVSSVERAVVTLESTLAAAGSSLGGIDGLVGHLDRIVTQSEGPIGRSLLETARAADSAGRLVENLNDLTLQTSHSITGLVRDLSVIARNLEKATENLDRLTELIADQPSQLIFGEPPPPRFPAPR